MIKLLSQNIVNLEHFPSITSDIAEHITIGDLHANALKLLHLLIQEGVFYTTPEQYHTFALLYQISAEQITQDELSMLLTIIETLEVRNPNIFIRLIGDEHFDRGSNDLYIDMILRKLHHESINYEIILSNHGAMSIQKIESFRRGNQLYHFDLEHEYLGLKTQEIAITQELIKIMESISNSMEQFQDPHPVFEMYQLHCERMEAFIDSSERSWEVIDQQFHDFYHALQFNTPTHQFYIDLEKQFEHHKNLSKLQYLSLNAKVMLAQRSSFKNLNTLCIRNLMDMERVLEDYDKHYTPYLKLLSYSIDRQTHTITLFSHAPCGIECIESLADFFSVPFQNDTIFSFAHMLDCINLQFINQYVKNEQISELLEPNSIIHEFIWNRNYDVLCRPKRMSEYHLNYVHGHDKDEVNREEHVFSLDSSLGSIAVEQENVIAIMSGKDLILKTQGEYTLPYFIRAAQQAFLSSLKDIIELSITVNQDSWRSSFESLQQLFQSFMARHAFESYIQLYCRFIQKLEPPISWALMEPQINSLEEIISLSPYLESISTTSFFSSSLKSQMIELKKFLHLDSMNTLKPK